MAVGRHHLGALPCFGAQRDRPFVEQQAAVLPAAQLVGARRLLAAAVPESGAPAAAGSRPGRRRCGWRRLRSRRGASCSSTAGCGGQGNPGQRGQAAAPRCVRASVGRKSFGLYMEVLLGERAAAGFVEGGADQCRARRRARVRSRCRPSACGREAITSASVAKQEMVSGTPFVFIESWKRIAPGKCERLAAAMRESRAKRFGKKRMTLASSSCR